MITVSLSWYKVYLMVFDHVGQYENHITIITTITQNSF